MGTDEHVMVVSIRHVLTPKDRYFRTESNRD